MLTAIKANDITIQDALLALSKTITHETDYDFVFQGTTLQLMISANDAPAKIKINTKLNILKNNHKISFELKQEADRICFTISQWDKDYFLNLSENSLQQKSGPNKLKAYKSPTMFQATGQQDTFLIWSENHKRPDHVPGKFYLTSLGSRSVILNLSILDDNKVPRWKTYILACKADEDSYIWYALENAKDSHYRLFDTSKKAIPFKIDQNEFLNISHLDSTKQKLAFESLIFIFFKIIFPSTVKTLKKENLENLYYIPNDNDANKKFKIQKSNFQALCNRYWDYRNYISQPDFKEIKKYFKIIENLATGCSNITSEQLKNSFYSVASNFISNLIKDITKNESNLNKQLAKITNRQQQKIENYELLENFIHNDVMTFLEDIKQSILHKDKIAILQKNIPPKLEDTIKADSEKINLEINKIKFSINKWEQLQNKLIAYHTDNPLSGKNDIFLFNFLFSKSVNINTVLKDCAKGTFLLQLSKEKDLSIDLYHKNSEKSYRWHANLISISQFMQFLTPISDKSIDQLIGKIFKTLYENSNGMDDIDLSWQLLLPSVDQQKKLANELILFNKELAYESKLEQIRQQIEEIPVGDVETDIEDGNREEPPYKRQKTINLT